MSRESDVKRYILASCQRLEPQAGMGTTGRAHGARHFAQKPRPVPIIDHHPMAIAAVVVSQIEAEDRAAIRRGDRDTCCYVFVQPRTRDIYILSELRSVAQQWFVKRQTWYAGAFAAPERNDEARRELAVAILEELRPFFPAWQ